MHANYTQIRGQSIQKHGEISFSFQPNFVVCTQRLTTEIDLPLILNFEHRTLNKPHGTAVIYRKLLGTRRHLVSWTLCFSVPFTDDPLSYVGTAMEQLHTAFFAGV